MERLLAMMANLDTSSGDRPPTLSPDLPEDELRSRMGQMKTWLNKQNSLPPSRVPPADRSSSIQRQLMISRSEQGTGIIAQTYVGAPKTFSSKPFEELSRGGGWFS
ncbi:hypothetical protein VKT23_003519 [Stygiomarasmius scandens]|uniref:Uncharacterized protein n=1 Tax=Marasmiellus scandens TaxID=2682957 RepID=A0ABR1K0H3_9AGAR